MSAHADPVLWEKLRAGGYVVMIRHATTVPGIGDPPGFRLGECSTQRNLSDSGRAEAKRLGGAFRREKVPVSQVLASEWCRCRDTAELAFGRYEPWPALNSFFADRATEPEQTRAVHERGSRVRPGENLVLVTHQVNISAVSGTFASQGDMVILKPAGPGRLELVGKIDAAR